MKSGRKTILKSNHTSKDKKRRERKKRSKNKLNQTSKKERIKYPFINGFFARDWAKENTSNSSLWKSKELNPITKGVQEIIEGFSTSMLRSDFITEIENEHFLYHSSIKDKVTYPSKNILK